MGEDVSIASLRSRVSALVEQEGALLTQAFELSRGGGDRRGVDALFAQVQAMQVERNRLKKQIGQVLGTQRLHEAAEVWRPGVYEYRREVGGAPVRVRITRGALGLQVHLPGEDDAVRIETLKGTFDGPLGADDAMAGGEAAQPQFGPPGSSGAEQDAPKVRSRRSRKSGP